MPKYLISRLLWQLTHHSKINDDVNLNDKGNQQKSPIDSNTEISEILESFHNTFKASP